MAWLAVDFDGEIFLSKDKPYRTINRNFPEKGFWKSDGQCYRVAGGKKFLTVFAKENMTWKNEPVEIKD